MHCSVFARVNKRNIPADNYRKACNTWTQDWAPKDAGFFFSAVRRCDCQSRSKVIKGCDNKMADRRSREHIKHALALSKQHVLRQRVGLQQIVSELMLLSLCQTAQQRDYSETLMSVEWRLYCNLKMFIVSVCLT